MKNYLKRLVPVFVEAIVFVLREISNKSQGRQE